MVLPAPLPSEMISGVLLWRAVVSPWWTRRNGAARGDRERERMGQISPQPLWLGHVGDAENLRGVLDAGIVALVDLAAAEPPVKVPRDLVYCRFPLVDGPDNPPWLLRAAVEATAGFLRAGVPVLV